MVGLVQDRGEGSDDWYTRNLGRIQKPPDIFLTVNMISLMELKTYCVTTIPKVTVAFLLQDSFLNKFITDLIARLIYLMKNSLDLNTWKRFLHSHDGFIWYSTKEV